MRRHFLFVKPAVTRVWMVYIRHRQYSSETAGVSAGSRQDRLLPIILSASCSDYSAHSISDLAQCVATVKAARLVLPHNALGHSERDLELRS